MLLAQRVGLGMGQQPGKPLEKNCTIMRVVDLSVADVKDRSKDLERPGVRKCFGEQLEVCRCSTSLLVGEGWFSFFASFICLATQAWPVPQRVHCTILQCRVFPCYSSCESSAIPGMGWSNVDHHWYLLMCLGFWHIGPQPRPKRAQYSQGATEMLTLAWPPLSTFWMDENGDLTAPRPSIRVRQGLWKQDITKDNKDAHKIGPSTAA